jgi:hypothetical protein
VFAGCESGATNVIFPDSMEEALHTIQITHRSMQSYNWTMQHLGGFMRVPDTNILMMDLLVYFIFFLS